MTEFSFLDESFGVGVSFTFLLSEFKHKVTLMSFQSITKGIVTFRNEFLSRYDSSV